MQRIIFCLLAFTCFIQSRAAQENYIETLQNTLKQYRCAYQVTYSLPGEQAVTSKGIMASSGEQLYDSSDLHLIVKNPQWLISVDFPGTYVSVLRNKSGKKDGIADGSTPFLLSDEFFKQNVQYKTRKQTNERIWIAISFKGKSAVKDMVAEFDKATGAVISISMELEQALERGNPSEQKASVKLQLTNITRQITNDLFSEKRLLRESGDKIILSKFKQYELSYHTI